MVGDCPFCKGSGRVKASKVLAEVYPDGLTCDACSATGRFEDAKLMRAFRLGQKYPSVELGMDRLRGAVIDDMRSQRVSEMLDPESVELAELRRQIEVLERERTPMLAALGELAGELRERLWSEIPMEVAT